MNGFWMATAAVLLAVIFGFSLVERGKEMGLLLTLAVCSMVAVLAISYLQPVITFVGKLQSVGQLDSGLLEILLKAVGIGIVGEIAGLICTDSGNAALGKVLKLRTTSVILWLSIPLWEKLLELLQEILGAI